MTAHVGVVIAFCMTVLGVLVALWLGVRGGRAAGDTVPAPEPPARERIDRRARSRFLLPALLLVLFNATTVVFFAWGPVFRTLGWSGVAAMIMFAMPIFVGVAYQWRMRALEW